MDIIRVSNLTKKFKGFTAVEEVSFSLRKGEILGFLGPNGAGKTTTIQMMLGVMTPTSGDVFYFGKNLKTNRQEILEQINFSSTYTNLPLDLTVKECLTYTAYLYKIKNRKERIQKIKELFQLDKLWEQQIAELSAGEQTKVNLAKAFINFPRVLLLDEPTASLDPDISKTIRDFILEEREKFNVSVLITSHNMAEVQEICDRVVFINRGKIIANDTPQNLARSISTSHLQLRLRNNPQKAENYCQKNKIACQLKGEYITMDVEESSLAFLLENLMREEIFYDEISIEKPNLEDYFLEVALKKK